MTETINTKECPKYPCDTCADRFSCYTDKHELIGHKISISKKVREAMLELDVPLPPAGIHCTKCGAKAVIVIRLAKKGYSLSGQPQFVFKAEYHCPNLWHFGKLFGYTFEAGRSFSRWTGDN